MKPVFTIDLEDWNHALHIEKNGHDSIDAVWWLICTLEEHGVTPIVYVLGKFNEEYPNLVKLISDWPIYSHGHYHIRGEKADRQPYEWLGLTGGFWFRLLPLWFLKKQIISNGQFYIHPHDLDEGHPKLSNPIMNWKRHVGLKGAKKKLEQLLQEVQFE